MTKEDKVLVIQEIRDLLQDAKVVYVADLEGLNAAKSSDFRRQAFKNNIKVKVVKNTLLQKAMEQMDVDFSEMFVSFKGNSALMISETANAPAKLIKDFRKKEEKPALKSAYLQETIYVGDENLETLANIKSKDEMLGEIIGLLQSPIQRLVSALQNRSESEEATTEETAPAEETKAEETPAAEAPEAAAEGETPAAE
ncbi:50S ribosomal protein L10 [Chryseobacterium lacus]|uniref:Large ribosomal subunit protein uL10 n=1 Tax=Chryseobacterium lacus TaxID=2058346 RepID=A0A368N1J5_9FLAO|nr:50S ribosomal protein L10 [Chryseobacterium lacus]RCU44040.1 50S ribosomal protein L10 [Chryseobacterium lacus]RST28970.1 50S ribosomal protein L10 [Chryseobacterium lacus]